jgi:hypothetical protein
MLTLAFKLDSQHNLGDADERYAPPTRAAGAQSGGKPPFLTCKLTYVSLGRPNAVETKLVPRSKSEHQRLN